MYWLHELAKWTATKTADGSCVQVCEAVSGSKSSAYTMKVLVPLISPLMATAAMQPSTFAKYMAFMKAALQRCEQQTASATKRPNSASSSAALATWDEPTQASASPAGSTKYNGAQSVSSGLGLGAGDALSDWSSSLCAPDTDPLSGPPTRPAGPSLNGKSSPHQGMAAAASPMPAQSSGQTVPMRAAPTIQTRKNAVPAHGSAVGGGPAMGMTHDKLHTSSPMSAATPVRRGHAGVMGHAAPVVNTPTAQFQSMTVGNANSDPFADLLGPQMSTSAAPGTSQPSKPSGQSLLDVAQPGKWDPFA